VKVSFLILIFIFTIFGCSSDTGSVNDAVTVKAENVREGIRLTFSNIPQDTSRLFIHFNRIDEEALRSEVSGANQISVFTDIRDASLELVKESGVVTCPFVQKGHEYYISIMMFNKYNEQNPSHWIRDEITADSGIYALNDVSLLLNDARTTVTLSQEPKFSADVKYASKKYRYSVTVKKDAYWGITYSETTGNTLTWDFYTMFEKFKNENIGVGGSLPAYVTASCSLTYEDLLWDVEIANSSEFFVAF